jgi:hypothetical protein
VREGLWPERIAGKLELFRYHRSTDLGGYMLN